MKEVKGKISGIGEKATRSNEITADDLAILRNYCFGKDYGIIDKENYNFVILNQTNTGIQLSKGVMYAYGYVGYIEGTNFEFIRPSIAQYHIIYGELNKSVIPNEATLKIKNNQSKKDITLNTFRQDYLSLIKTGIFQMPLYIVKLNYDGIEEVTDIRRLSKCIGRSEYSPKTSHIINSLDENVILTNVPDITDKSQAVVNADWVYRAIQQAISE